MQWETIFGQVIGKANNYIIGNSASHGSTIIKNDKIRRYERLFSEQCIIYRGALIKCEFGLYLRVYDVSFRYDLDNSIKTILDCLQYSEVIVDDNLCVGINASKFIDKYKPRIEYAIKPLFIESSCF